MKTLIPLLRPTKHLLTSARVVTASSSRSFQVSSINLKKKPSKALQEEEEDFDFSTEDPSDDLFSSSSSSTSNPLKASGGGLSPSQKTELFNSSLQDLYSYYTTRRFLSLAKREKKPNSVIDTEEQAALSPMKKTVLTNLIQSLTEREQFGEVKRGLKVFRWSGGVLSEHVVRRLEEKSKALEATDFMQEILSDPITYGVHLPQKTEESSTTSS